MGARERALREQATRIAREMVARWEHGDEKHREWLRGVAVPDIVDALLAWGERHDA